MSQDSFSFKTERIFARPWQLEDAEQALAIYANPKVTRYMPNAIAENLEQMRQRLEKIVERDSKWPTGIGSYASFCRQSGQLLGNLLIKPLPDNEGNFTEQIEIGWHLDSPFWGKGYATEGAQGLLQVGFEKLNLDEIYAVVKTENQKSVNVTSRLGMKHLGLTDRYYGETIELFVIRKQDWVGSNPDMS